MRSLTDWAATLRHSHSSFPDDLRDEIDQHNERIVGLIRAEGFKAGQEAMREQMWKDVETRFRSLLEGEFSHLYLTFNEHAGSYETVRQNEEDGGSFGEWVSEEERQKGMLENSKWMLQWYPHTPVGFSVLCASSLPSLMAAIPIKEPK